MMRPLLFISLLITGLGCSGPKNAAVKPNKLNGTWIPLSQEMGGKQMPKSFYENSKHEILDSTYTLTAESVDKGVVKYHGDKMDIYGREGVNKGKHFTALYKYENAQLTICYNLTGNSYPETFDTKGKPLYFLSIYKRN